MMPLGQKHEPTLNAPREAQGLGDEKVPEAEEAAASAASSAALIPGMAQEVAAQGACSSCTPIQASLLSESSEVCSGHTGKNLRTSYARPCSHFLLRTLKRKVVEVVKFLNIKYATKEPITKAEIMKKVIKEHKYYFPVIFQNVYECMEIVFGIEVKEVDATNNVYELVKILDLTYDGRLSDGQGIPKTGLLMLILAVIFIEGNRAPEEKIWGLLRMVDIYPDKHGVIFANPKKLVSEEFVQEGYLKYWQVPNSDPPRFEFFWGPRARAETSKMKALQFYAKISGSSPTDCLDLYREALRDEEVRAARLVALAAGFSTISVDSIAKFGTA